MINLNKHFLQIKKGGVIVVIKKIRSLFYLLLNFPIYVIAIPTLIILYLIRPFFLVRWQKLNSQRIGHFVPETELYCCERDAGINVPSQRYVDFFYLSKYVSNKQIEKMWRRSIIILPRWLLIPLFRTNRFFNLFVQGGGCHEININPKAYSKERDIHGMYERFKTHIGFTHEEEIKGKRFLKKLGIPQDVKFVCLVVRDSGYLDRQQKKYNLRDWNYHNYRDGDIDNYVLAAEELARRGYYVFRMGINVLKPLKSSNPKVIDYANLGIRSNFMDIYLGAKCSFCLSADSGFEHVPTSFRRPLCGRHVPLAFIYTNNPKSLLITKHHIHKKSKKELTLSEIFSSNAAMSVSSEEFEQNGVELEESSPEEIRDLVIEMDERLNGNWNETEEDLLLQKKFWSIFIENMKRLNLKQPMHGKIRAKFSAKFLRDNQNWIR
ncbi:MAG: TIGR04372 family glycosyltransferase [SAR202 cluster bacterium]|nr:TIGR04372 family glycosyltransferase [SAR202 cluster bacterium]